MTNSRLKLFMAVLITALVLSFFVRLPYLKYCAASPESLLDYSIGKNLAEKAGFKLFIRETYETDGPVVQVPSGYRGVIYPLALSFQLKKTDKLQWFNIILSIINAIMFFYLVKIYFDRRVAWLSFLTFLFLPGLNLAASFMWNITLVVFSILIFGLIYGAGENNSRLLAASGAALGFGYWCEPWFIFYLPAFLPGLLLSGKNLRDSIKLALTVLAGFTASSLPLFIWIFSIHKAIIPPQIMSYFKVLSQSAYVYDGYGKNLPGVIQFISTGISHIGREISRSFQMYFHGLVTLRTGFVFLFALPGLLLAGKKAYVEFPRRYLPLLSFSLLYFLGSCLFWSNRDFLKTPLYLLLFVIPVLFYFLCRIEFRQFPAGFIAAILLMIFALNSYLEVNHSSLRLEIGGCDLSRLKSQPDPQSEWINKHTDPNDRVAALFPWTVNLRTGRPCGMMPNDIKPEQLREFAEKFHYNYFISNDLGNRGEKFRKNVEDANIPWLSPEEEDLWRVNLPPKQ